MCCSEGTDKSMEEAGSRFIKELEDDKNNFIEEEQLEIQLKDRERVECFMWWITVKIKV